MSCTTTAKSTHTSIFLVLPADHHVIIIIMPTNHRPKTLQPHSIKPCICSLLIHLAMWHAFIQHDNKQEANTNVSHHLQEYQLATNQEISKISDLQIQEPAVPCRQCEQESMCVREMPLNTWFVSVVAACYKSSTCCKPNPNVYNINPKLQPVKKRRSSTLIQTASRGDTFTDGSVKYTMTSMMYLNLRCL